MFCSFDSVDGKVATNSCKITPLARIWRKNRKTQHIVK